MTTNIWNVHVWSIRGFRDTCSSVEKVRLAVRHPQRRVHAYDAVYNMTAHSILFITYTFARLNICVKSILWLKETSREVNRAEPGIHVSNSLLTVKLKFMLQKCKSKVIISKQCSNYILEYRNTNSHLL